MRQINPTVILLFEPIIKLEKITMTIEDLRGKT
jgi:hypothetical protein